MNVSLNWCLVWHSASRGTGSEVSTEVTVRDNLRKNKDQVRIGKSLVISISNAMVYIKKIR